MDVLGLTGIQATFIILVIGIATSVVLGWLKGKEPFNPRQVAASVILAFFISFPIVGAAVDVLPDGIEELAAYLIFVGLIAQVAGVDSIGKSAVKAALKAHAKK